MIIPTKSAESHTIRSILIGLAAGLALVAAINFIYTRVSSTNFKELNEANWKLESVGAPYISFDSPVALTNVSRPPNEKEREFVQYQMSYTYKEGRDLIIVASVLNYHRHVYVDPMAAEQSVQAFASLYQAKNITHEATPMKIGEYPALRVDGRFQVGDRQYVYARVSVEHKNLVRDLLVIVKDGDMEAARFLDRMITSVGMEPI